MQKEPCQTLSTLKFILSMCLPCLMSTHETVQAPEMLSSKWLLSYGLEGLEMIEAITIYPTQIRIKAGNTHESATPVTSWPQAAGRWRTFPARFRLTLNLVTMTLSYLSSSSSLAVSALTSVVYGYLTFNLGMTTNTEFSPNCVSENESQIEVYSSALYSSPCYCSSLNLTHPCSTLPATHYRDSCEKAWGTPWGAVGRWWRLQQVGPNLDGQRQASRQEF